MNPTPPDTGSDDALLQLQLRIARRADEIAREKNFEKQASSHCWLLAESEVLARESAKLLTDAMP